MPYYKDLVEVKKDAVPPTPGMAPPTFWTPMKSTRSLGDDIIAFVEEFVTPPRTMNPDEDFSLMEWQKWLLRHIFELDEETGLLRYREIYLQIPRKNGKSFLASCILLYFLIKGNDGEELWCGAKDSKQAHIVYNETLRTLHNSPVLQMVAKGNKVEMANILKNIRLRMLTADSGAAHGWAPYGVVLDELHKFDSLSGKSNRGEDLIAAVTTGSKDRLENWTLMITTAGDTINGIAHKRRILGEQIATGVVSNDSFGFFVWEAEEEDDIYSPDTWRKANPSLFEGKLNFNSFMDDVSKAQTQGSGDFERYNLNKWLRAGNKEDFIPKHLWDFAFSPSLASSMKTRRIPKGSVITVGFDGSLANDSTAFVAIDAVTGLQEVLYAWDANPLDKEWRVPLHEVDVAMAQIMKDYRVALFYGDDSFYHQQFEAWRMKYGRGIVRDIPQTRSRMVELSNSYKASLAAGEIFHVDEPKLTLHARNAVVKGERPYKETQSSPNKIDRLICAILANGARVEAIERGIIPRPKK